MHRRCEEMMLPLSDWEQLCGLLPRASLSLRRHWECLETSMVAIVVGGEGEGVMVSFTGQRLETPLVHSVVVHAQLFVTPWIASHQASLSFTFSWSLLKLMSIEVVMPSNHLILCCPLLLLPSIFLNIRVFSESPLCIRWPKYWSFSFSISHSNEYSRLIFFRIDLFDPLAIQGTLKSLLQQHSLKASILRHSAFFRSNSHIHTWLLEKPYLWLYRPLLSK